VVEWNGGLFVQRAEYSRLGGWIIASHAKSDTHTQGHQKKIPFSKVNLHQIELFIYPHWRSFLRVYHQP
jgi:hypothetical protein